MISINEDKTKKILRDIDEHVSIEDLGLLFRKTGVLTKIHVGRARGGMKVNVKAFGINDKEILVFMDDYFRNGTFSYIGLNKNKKLLSIEVNLRKELASRAIGYEGQFLTIEDYKDFKEIVEREKKRYFAIRDEIYNNWDSIIGEFKCKLKDSLFKMGCKDPNIYQSILDEIPSKKAYRDSFYIDVSLRAFPILENASVFEPEIMELLEDTQENELVSCINEVTGNVLGLAFSSLNNVVAKCSENGKVEFRTKNILNTTYEKMVRRNLSGNMFIRQIADDLKKSYTLVDNKDYDDFLEFGEDILTRIYGYLKEINLLQFIDFKKSEYSKEELDMLYNIYLKNKLSDCNQKKEQYL